MAVQVYEKLQFERFAVSEMTSRSLKVNSVCHISLHISDISNQ